MALVIFLVPCLVDCGPLRNTFIVAPPDNVGAVRKVQYALDSFPNLDVAAAVVLCPNAEDVFTTPDAEDNAANLLTGLGELVTNNGQKELLPVAISYTLLQTHDPLSTPLVFFVFPDRPYAMLEQIIVGHGW